jgi:amino acid adenylation domain-containing protein
MHILQAIRRSASRTPGAIAFHTVERSLSYAEFLERVDGLARRLQRRGIGPGSRVAICLDRSFEMMVGIFGVLASGAAYVPLDSESPAPRLRSILSDSQPSLCLAGANCQLLCDLARVPRLDPNDWPVRCAPVETLPSGPAYLIYTSGSTGQPKGVVIGHAALENYLSWACSTLPFVGGGCPLFGNISFDHSITSYYPPLMKGETVFLLPSVQGGRALARGLLQRRQYSYVKITPSHFTFLTTDERAILGRQTNLLMFGGERVTPQLIADARRDNPKLAILNHYGPTETTVGCCVYNVPPGFRAHKVPIGHPIPNARATVRQPNLKAVRVGRPGELFIGGKPLADGYWQRPELTAKSFIRFRDARGVMRRWYRTGDLVRRLRNGNLEFLGRGDDQIKLLGHRIELGEIEQILRLHPKIAQAAVISGEREEPVELIAAIVSSFEYLAEEEIRRHLRSNLPSTMVPARIIRLKQLPVNANGKLDQRRIRELAKKRKAQSSRELEELLEERFRAALGLDIVGADDDFFELGGDSMATVEITLWASECFQVNLEISALFDYPTIRSLAGRIRDLIAAET